MGAPAKFSDSGNQISGKWCIIATFDLNSALSVVLLYVYHGGIATFQGLRLTSLAPTASMDWSIRRTKLYKGCRKNPMVSKPGPFQIYAISIEGWTWCAGLWCSLCVSDDLSVLADNNVEHSASNIMSNISLLPLAPISWKASLEGGLSLHSLKCVTP